MLFKEQGSALKPIKRTDLSGGNLKKQWSRAKTDCSQICRAALSQVPYSIALLNPPKPMHLSQTDICAIFLTGFRLLPQKNNCGFCCLIKLHLK
jgi:hypothetical protein